MYIIQKRFEYIIAVTFLFTLSVDYCSPISYLSNTAPKYWTLWSWYRTTIDVTLSVFDKPSSQQLDDAYCEDRQVYFFVRYFDMNYLCVKNRWMYTTNISDMFTETLYKNNTNRGGQRKIYFPLFCLQSFHVLLSMTLMN